MRGSVDVQSPNILLTVKMTMAATMVSWLYGSTNGEITTKFKNEENQKVELKDELPACLIEGTSTEPGDGWCGN